MGHYTYLYVLSNAGYGHLIHSNARQQAEQAAIWTAVRNFLQNFQTSGPETSLEFSKTLKLLKHVYHSPLLHHTHSTQMACVGRNRLNTLPKPSLLGLHLLILARRCITCFKHSCWVSFRLEQGVCERPKMASSILLPGWNGVSGKHVRLAPRPHHNAW